MKLVILMTMIVNMCDASEPLAEDERSLSPFTTYAEENILDPEERITAIRHNEAAKKEFFDKYGFTLSSRLPEAKERIDKLAYCKYFPSPEAAREISPTSPTEPRLQSLLDKARYYSNVSKEFNRDPDDGNYFQDVLSSCGPADYIDTGNVILINYFLSGKFASQLPDGCPRTIFKYFDLERDEFMKLALEYAIFADSVKK